MTVSLDALTASVSLTVLTAIKGNASKRLIADAHGRPVPEPTHSLWIAEGHVEHVQVAGLGGLRDLLGRITPKQALVHGIPTGSLPGAMLQLVVAQKYTGVPGTIARTLECFSYPPGLCLIMFDYDPDPTAQVQVTSAAALLEHMAALWPAFGDVGYLTTTSTRSAIRAKAQPGDWLTPPHGMHIYFLATGDVARFRELLRIKLWCAGLGFCKLATANKDTGVAALLERALVDLTVLSPERLDYVAGAQIAKNAPFFQDRPPPELRAGIVLNLDELPDATDEERQEYALRLEAAQDALRPVQRETARQTITQQAPTLSAREQEQEITRRITHAAQDTLAPDHPLYFPSRTITAQELTTRAGKALDGKRLRDPQEPDYGPSQAVLHWNQGNWLINSWAHGILKTYRLARPAPPPPPDDDMANLIDQVEQETTRGTTVSVSPQQKRFRVSEKGVWYRPDLDELGNQPPDVWVCDELRIVAATRDLDNDNHGNLLAFRDKHGHPQEWAMPLELLEDQREYRKVLRRLGLRINGAAKAHLQLYLDIWQTDAVARCVDRVGWHNGAYVLPDTTLGDTGSERLVLQNLDRRSEGYRQSGTIESWRQTIAAACVGNSRLLLAVSTAFAAPLLALLDEESGGLHFRGPSSSGKTTAVYVAATVWGEPSRLERWRATANALEGVALAHNDNLLCLDELKELDPREAGGVAYMLANGAGKRRGQPYGGTRPRLTWRLLFLSTGETSLDHHIAEAGQRIHAGQEVRLVDVPADAGANLGLFEHLHGLGTGQAFADQLREYTRQHYGHAGRAFVTLLAQDREGHKAQGRECMAAFVEREVPAEATGQVARVAQRFALIAAAGELATAGELTGWPEGEAFAAAQRCFRDWLGQRGSVGNADDARALAQVRLYFEKYGVSRFEPWRESDGETCQRCHGTGHVSYTYMEGICFTCHGTKVITPDHPAIRLIQSHAGWSKATEDGQTEFYVEQEVFRQDIARGLDVQWLCRLLKAKGYLLPDSRGKNRRRERLPGRGLGEVYRITAKLLGAQKPGEKEEEESEM